MYSRSVRFKLFVTLALCAVGFGPVRAEWLRQSTSFYVGGAVAKPSDWTVERLSTELASSVQTVKYTLKGVNMEAMCVPLLALVNSAVPKVEPKRKNHRIAFAVVARGSDGYTASFGLGELDKELGNRPVWLSFERNGKPIPTGEGPVELLVPEDGKPARWVHKIANIDLVDLSTPTGSAK